METQDTGGEGEEVERHLEAVETPDILGDAITDGREIYSEAIALPPDYALVERHPEDSRPTQSGV
jgi:hypothetical protein